MAIRRRPPGVDPTRTDIVTRPVNTFARPEAPALPPDAPARTDLLRLAQSLSGTSDALADYAKTYTRNRAVGQAEAGESAALGLRLNTTRDELSRMLKTGNVPAGVNKRLLEIGHGENLAQDFVQDIRQRYLGQSTAGPNQPSNAFDRNAGDVDAWFKQLTQEREGQLPQFPGVLLGWRRVMTEEQQRLLADQNQHIQERTLQANLDAAHGAFYGIATNEIANGNRDPQAIRNKMQEALPRLRQLHLLTPKQANAALFSSARAIAEQGIPGNPKLGVDLVREMLVGERRGANGQILGPLGGSAEYAHLTNQTIEAAQRKAGELQRTLETETIVRFREDAANGQLNEFLRGRGEAGTLQGIPERMRVLKPNGEQKEIQRAELLDRARDNELARIDEWGRQQAAIEAEAQVRGPVSGPSVSQRVFDRQYDFLNRNGLEHPGWKDTLSGGYAAATPAAVAGSQLPPLLTQAAQLYETLEARAPGMLERHLPSQAARDFYRTYRIGRTGLRMDERQAMVFATTATSDIGSDETRAPKFKMIETELANAQSIFPWTEGVTNFGDMRDDIARISRALVRTGMAPEAAVREAGKDVRAQYTNINGYMVRTGDRAIEMFGAHLSSAGLQPKPFEDTVRRYLEAYAKDNPSAADTEVYDAPFMPQGEMPPDMTTTARARRNLSIRPTPGSAATGAWSIIDAVTGLPVPSGPNGMRQTIGLRDLLAFEQQSQREEQAKEAERLAKAAKDKPPKPAPTWSATRPSNYRRPRISDQVPRSGWPEE